MTRTSQPRTTGLVLMALYVIGACAALTALLLAGMWQPEETFMQAGRAILLVLAGIALVMCVLGATSKLIAAAGATVPDADPKA